MRKSGRASTKPELFQVSVANEKQRELQAKQAAKHEQSSSSEQIADNGGQKLPPVDVRCFKETNPEAKCILCKKTNEDEMLWGELLSCYDPEEMKKLGMGPEQLSSKAQKGNSVYGQLSATSVHYGCLLSACNLWQKGNDTLQLKGFLVSDVRSESRRCSREVCVFCGQKGAVVGCCLKKCKRMFHFPCALASDKCITEFFGCYNSYCDLHSEPQQIPPPEEDEICSFCVEPLVGEERRLFCAECCGNVLHTSCLRPYVYNAGMYYLKCPFCQNVRRFKELVSMYSGIHIPTREPTYENHDRMVVELVCCYEHCPDPDLCLDNEDWRLIKCTVCGSRAMHVMCVAKAFSHSRFICPDCGDNDATEACYRLQVRVGSGRTVGRMFPWQFLAMKQLLHSVVINNNSTQSQQAEEEGKILRATEQKNGENQSKRNSRNKQTKRKSKREFDRDEIEFEKRGTKELLGEVEVSSDEDDEGEGDNDRQQQSRMSSASHSSPLDVSYDEVPSDSESEEAARRKSEEVTIDKTEETDSSKASGRKRKRNKHVFSKQPKAKKVEPQSRSKQQNKIPVSKLKSVSKKQKEEVKVNAKSVSIKKPVEEKVRDSKSQKAEKWDVGSKPSSVSPSDVSISSKENHKPGSSKVLKVTRQSESPKSSKAISLDESETASSTTKQQFSEGLRRGRSKQEARECEVVDLRDLISSRDSDSDSSDIVCLTEFVRLAENESPKGVLGKATLFQRPMKDEQNMRQVVVSRTSMESKSIQTIPVTITDISTGHSKSPFKGAEKFHFEMTPERRSTRGTVLAPLSLPTNLPPTSGRSPLSLRVHSLDKNNDNESGTVLYSSRLRKSPRPRGFALNCEINRISPQHHTY